MAWVPAALGGLSAVAGLFSGGGGGRTRRSKISKLPTKLPEQEAFLKSLYGGGGIESNPLYQQGQSNLMRTLQGGPEAYNAFEAPLLQQFNQQTIPDIIERFGAMGTGAGATSSGGLNQAIAQAMQALGVDLGGIRANLQNQATGQALGYAQQPQANKLAGLQIDPFAYHEQQATPGSPSPLSNIFGGLAGGLSQGFGQMAGNYFGNKTFGSPAMQPSSGSPGGSLSYQRPQRTSLPSFMQR